MIQFDLHSNNTAKITSDDLPLIRERLSVVNKGARFARAKNYRVSDRFYGITKSGKFEIGLYGTIVNEIKKLNLLPDIKVSKEFLKRLMPSFKLDGACELGKLTLTPYDYQTETVRKMISFGRGCVLIGTGGGKTLIMSLFLSTIIKHLGKQKTLIIVPTIQLVEQTYSDMLEYGFSKNEITKWSGKNEFVDADIIIAGVDILQSPNSDLSFLKSIKILIVDEVHIVKRTNLVNKVIDRIPTAHRYGFTGTLPEEKIDQWNIFGRIGKIIYHKPSDHLRARAVISPVKVDILRLSYSLKTNFELKTQMNMSDRKYQTELDFMIDNAFRNKIICLIGNTTKRNTLIMVDRIHHGELLQDMLKQMSNKKVYFIQGSVEMNTREEVRKLMEHKHDIICVAMTSIFSTGINIKNIHNIIFTTPGKAKVKLIQSIGRGLRLHEEKDILNVYDMADEFKYSSRHLEKRKKLYDSEKINYEIREIREK